MNLIATLRSKHPAVAAGALLVALLALGALLRFHALGRKSLWLDEAVTMNFTACRFPEMLAAVVGHDGHPPVYYVLVHSWMRVFHGAGGARGFSALAGVGTLLAFYFLARALLPRDAALVAALLLAVSAFQVYFAQEARNYALAAFLVTLSWCFFAQLLKGQARPSGDAGSAGGEARGAGRLGWWVGLALANAAAVLTFYYCAFAAIAQFVVLLALWRSAGRRLMLRWVLWQCVPVGLLALYAPVVLKHLSGAPPAPGPGVLSGEGLLLTSAQFTCGFLGKLSGEYGAVAQAGAAALGFLALAAGAVGLRRQRGAAAAALAWLLVPLGILGLLRVGGHAYEPKHLIVAAPALAFLPAVGWAATRGVARGLVGLLVALIVVANGASLARYYDPRVEKENWRDAVAEIVRHVEPGDVVVVNPFYDRHPFHYYYRPHYRDLPVLVVEAPVAGKPFRAGELRRDRRVWVLEGASNVEIPNPEVARALRAYPQVLPPRRFEGLVGTVTVSLYDTFRPAAKGTAPGAGRRETRSQ